MNGLALLLTLALAIGIAGLYLVVQAARAERNHARLAEQRASLVDERARRDEARRDAPPHADVSADDVEETSLTSYTLFI